MAGQPGRSLWKSFGPDIFSVAADVEVKMENEFPGGPEQAGKWQQFYTSTGQDPLVDREKTLERWLDARDAPGSGASMHL